MDMFETWAVMLRIECARLGLRVKCDALAAAVAASGAVALRWTTGIVVVLLGGNCVGAAPPIAVEVGGATGVASTGVAGLVSGLR